VPAQSLELFDDAGRLIRKYPVSTSKNGRRRTMRQRLHAARQAHRSRQDRHRAAAQYRVRGAPARGRGVHQRIGARYPGRDWILTRILWLSGCEPGFNRLRQVDTMRRLVYIHGTSDEQGIGSPLSHGCIRMRNRDVVELFDQVTPGTPVDILET